jgi:recombination protein RecT
MSNNTQVAKQGGGDLKSLINSRSMQEQFSRALPRHLSADRFTRIAITALSRTPKLMNCTPQSLMKCLLDLSAMGLEPDGRRAHLIPYGNECTLIVDYKGLVELIRRSGDVVSLRAETVCREDEFEWVNGEITHKIDWRNSRGDVQAVYAEAKMKDGETQTTVLTRDEVEGIRARSKSGNNGPWVTDWAEMAKKTAVRRLSKMLPLSSEVSIQLEADDKYNGLKDDAPFIDTDAEEEKPKPASRVEQAKQKIKAEPKDKPLTDQVLDLCKRDNVNPANVHAWMTANEPSYAGSESLMDAPQKVLSDLVKAWDDVRVNFVEA